MSSLFDLGRAGTVRHERSDADTHTWLTPPDILRALGGFDLDPCACPLPRPWPTATTMWTREDGSLRRDWHGRVWLNPPFGPRVVLGAFMRRLVAHGRGSALLFARTDTELFAETVWDAAHAVMFLRGRPHFYRQDGTRADFNSGAPVLLVAYGAEDASALEHSGLAGKFVRLGRE